MGKFEKQNRPGTYSGSPSRRASEPLSGVPQNKKKPASKKAGKAVLPIVLGALVVGVGVVAGLLCMKFFGKEQDPTLNQIKPDVYIAGVNVGGLEKSAALDLLMQTYPPLTPPATTPEGVIEGPVLAQLYADKNMNIRLYTTPEEITLYTGTYDPSTVIPVDIYGKPLEQEATEATEESSTEETSETTEPTQATTAVAIPEDLEAPRTEDGKEYILDKTLVLPASQVNVTLDLSAAVDAAFAVGREGGPEVQEDGTVVDLTSFLSLDTVYIRDVLDSAYEDILMQATATKVEEGEVTVMDEENKEIRVDGLHITFGTMGRKLDTEALYDQIMEAYATAEFEVQAIYEEELPETLDLNKIYADYKCKLPVNAVCDPETFEITPESMGYGFLMEDALALAENAKPGDTITLTLIELKPQHTKENMEKLLFKDILGSCVSPHVWNPTRTRNLELAAGAINGTILLPGEEFSFNRIVGERTAEKGYGEAGVYVGGRTENQLGGGVCQVASAIYYSCLKADLKIVERYEHQYTPTYVPWGMDATIYWGSLDYRFVNNTPYPIRVDASVHDGSVYIDLVGTETRNYRVKLDYSVVEEDPSEEKTIYIHPDMKDYHKFKDYKHGETIQTAYDGYKVKTYMYKYDLDGNHIETIWINNSNYDRRDKEIAYVLDPSKPMKDQINEIENPTEPTEPPTEPTEPPTEPTEPSTEPTEPPTEPTEPPTEPTEPEPTEETPGE